MALPSASGQHRTPQPLPSSGEDTGRPTELETSPEERVIFYVGAESLTLTNLLLTHAAYEVHQGSPNPNSLPAEPLATGLLI